MTSDDSLYLQHILDAVARIQNYLHDVDEDTFLDTPLLQDGVIRQIEIIGEATKRLSLDTRVRYPHIPWIDMAGMRDKLIHDYFGVDLETVWLTSQEDIPQLAIEIEVILTEYRT